MKCKNEKKNLVFFFFLFFLFQQIFSIQTKHLNKNDSVLYKPDKVDKEINSVNRQIDNFVNKINKTAHFLKKFQIKEKNEDFKKEIPNNEILKINQNDTNIKLNSTKVQEQITSNNNTIQTSSQLLYSYFYPSYSIMEEMQINHDERQKLFIYKM